MSSIPQNSAETAPQLSEAEASELMQALRRKQGNWVEWGHACQTLQKAGYSPQAIFEATGFEPIQQNQITVAAQVYQGIISTGISPEAQTHFSQQGSDSLYELRILNQADRAAAAEFLLVKKLDSEQAHEVAKAVKDYSRLPKLPEGFASQTGDAVAYQYWRQARQKSDLQERSRLIAKAFSFVETESARKEIEKLLVDFTVVSTRKQPLWPVYRLDTDENLPQMLPIVGRMPLTKADLQAVPLVERIEPFSWVKFSGEGAWVALPGWQVLLNAEDPVAIFGQSNDLPNPLDGPVEPILLVVDRAQRDWDDNSYFLYEHAEQLELQWFAEKPNHPLLGRVILVTRPPKVLDANYTKELWQIDE